MKIRERIENKNLDNGNEREEENGEIYKRAG